jgi:hypothetical protein
LVLGVSAVVKLVKEVGEGLLVRLDLDHSALADKHVEHVSFYLLHAKGLHILLHKLEDSSDLLLEENLLRLMVGKKHDKLLFQQFSLVLLVDELIFVLDFILDDLFNDVLHGHDSHHFVSVVHLVRLVDLRYNSNMGETLLEVSQKWLKSVF